MVNLGQYSQLYHSIDLKDRNTVKELLYHRAYFENSKYTSDGTMFNKVQVTHRMYDDLINIYIDLDNLIKDCNFSDKNMRLLRLVEGGRTISYIYKNFENYNEDATIKMFDRMIREINNKQREKEGVRDENFIAERRAKKT